MTGEIATVVLFILLFRALFALDNSARAAQMESAIERARKAGPVAELPKGAVEHLIRRGRVVMQDVIK